MVIPPRVLQWAHVTPVVVCAIGIGPTMGVVVGMATGVEDRYPSMREDRWAHDVGSTVMTSAAKGPLMDTVRKGLICMMVPFSTYTHDAHTLGMKQGVWGRHSPMV
jgi:hypothetical protein